MKSQKRIKRTDRINQKKCPFCKKWTDINYWLSNWKKGEWTCLNCGKVHVQNEYAKINWALAMNNYDLDYDYGSFMDAETKKGIIRFDENDKELISKWISKERKRTKIIEKEINITDGLFDWPFTIDKGILKCYGYMNDITFTPQNGIEYALNGIAKNKAKEKGYDDISFIWRWKGDGQTRVSLQPVFDYVIGLYDGTN